MKLLCKKPIFIVGEGRSGTTLLRNILAQHRNIWAVDRESYIFVDKWPQKNPYFEKCKGDLPKLSLAVIAAMKRVGPKAHQVMEQENIDDDIQEAYDEYIQSGSYKNLELMSSHIEVFDSIANYFSSKKGAQRIIEKTPYHINYVDQILNFYPDAQIIAIYRDPRAVVASWLKKDKHKSFLGVCSSWKNAMSKILSMQGKYSSEQINVLSYEDLISMPENTLKDLCNWLGEDFDKALLAEQKANTSFESKEKGFVASNINRWQSTLSSEDIALVDHICSTKYGAFKLGVFSEKINYLSQAQLYLRFGLELLKFIASKFFKLVKMN